jgi:H+/Cl- antiporter ClcA
VVGGGTAAADVAVGLVLRLTRLPWKTRGLFEELQTQQVETGLVPGIAGVSLVSLIGGASLGREKALVSMGGGAGSGRTTSRWCGRPPAGAQVAGA